MRQTIRVAGRHFDIDSEELQLALAAVPDLRAARPWCMCAPGNPPEMYVSKVRGRYIVKRMPGTSNMHDASCASYEPPPGLSGFAEVDGRSILYDEARDLTTLKVAFALSQAHGQRAAPSALNPADTARSSPQRLSMRSTIDYLWERAQLNRWHPSMAGRRNYAVIFKYIRQAAEQTSTKGQSLAQLLYMPEPFYPTSAAEIRVRAHHALARCSHQRSGTQQLMLVFGEIKAISDARSGWQLQLKHAPFLAFYAARALSESAKRLFAAEVELWNADAELHLLLLASVAQNAAGILELQEFALATVDAGWMPVGSAQDVQLCARLAHERRSFIRPLAYGSSMECAVDALLTDTGSPIGLRIQVTPTETQSPANAQPNGMELEYIDAAQLHDAVLPQPRRQPVASNSAPL